MNEDIIAKGGDLCQEYKLYPEDRAVKWYVSVREEEREEVG